MFRSCSFPTWRVWRLFVLLCVVLVFKSFHTEAQIPGGTCLVFVLSGRWHPNCFIAANFWLQRLQMFILIWMSQRRYINLLCQVGVFDISVSSANSFILSQQRNKKIAIRCATVVLLYYSLSIGWLFPASTAFAKLRFPSTAGPFPETKPYLPVSDELPVIKLAARNKTTRLRGSGGDSGGLKPFNVGRETAETWAELPESKTRGSKKRRDQWLRA